jgi:hypothetical protein
VFGERVEKIEKPLALGLLVVVALLAGAAILLARRWEESLAQRAERASGRS